MRFGQLVQCPAHVDDVADEVVERRPAIRDAVRLFEQSRRPLRTRAHHGQRSIPRDCVRPHAEGRSPGKAIQPTPGGQLGIGKRIQRVLRITGDVQANAVGGALSASPELSEGVLVAVSRGLHEVAFGVSRPPLPEFVHDHGCGQRSSASAGPGRFPAPHKYDRNVG